MALPQKSVNEFKVIFKSKYGKELTDAEARESAENLVNFYDLLWKCAEKNEKRKRQLKKQPKGFHVTDGTYNCAICYRMVAGDETWYDQWGVKCLLCQKAVTEEIVPGFACTERDSRYVMWELKDKFKIHPQTARKLIRQGELKARVIGDENGKPYEYIFLKKENLHLISRYSPERKSYDRHRKKEANRSAREWKFKMQEEKKKIKNSRPL